MMKICVISDLHTDFSQPPIDWPDAQVLVIGGDTANTIGGELKLLRRVSKLYEYVITVDGNHTHYSNASQKRTIEETISSLLAQIPKNVYLLGHHLPHIELNDVHFVGCNGWYSFDMVGDPITNRVYWKKQMNDNRWIGFDQIEQAPPWDCAINDATLIFETLHTIKDDKPIVVVTHTAPHRDMVEWTTDPNWNRSNSFYVNSHMQRVLESEVGQRVTHWCNGHTHHRRERMIGQVHCICNPRGYPTENPRWEPVVIDI